MRAAHEFPQQDALEKAVTLDWRGVRRRVRRRVVPSMLRNRSSAISAHRRGGGRISLSGRTAIPTNALYTTNAGSWPCLRLDEPRLRNTLDTFDNLGLAGQVDRKADCNDQRDKRQHQDEQKARADVNMMMGLQRSLLDFVLNEIIGSFDQHLRVLPKVPQPDIAARAEETSYGPCLVVMIDTQP